MDDTQNFENLYIRLLDGKLTTDFDRLKSFVLPNTCEMIKDNDGRHYFVEPTHYGTLQSYVAQRKHLDESEAQSIFRQLVEILAFCHQLGILIRNLKTRDIVFNDYTQKSIRLANPLELHVCNDINNDTVNGRNKFSHIKSRSTWLSSIRIT